MVDPQSIDPRLLSHLASIVPPHRLEIGAPLAPLTTFRIGGPADLLVRVRSRDEMVEVMQCLRQFGATPVLLGHGANVLVSDSGIRGVVIRCEIGGIEWIEPHTVRAGSGVPVFHDLIDASVSRGLGGLHHYAGIPGTVGGALWQNLHFLSPDRDRTCFIEEVVAGAEILTEEGEVRRVSREYFEFGYDTSILHSRNDTVLTADFRLEPQPIDELRRVIAANLEWRDERHPDLWLYPCAGSIFKKIEGIGAGRLIDEAGLKGTTIGGAQIFRRHANIIVNLGGATASDVLALIRLAQERVVQATGHMLEPEIRLLGAFD